MILRQFDHIRQNHILDHQIVSVQLGKGHVVHLFQSLAGGHVSVAAVVIARIGTGEMKVMMMQAGGRNRRKAAQRLTRIHETAILAHHVSTPLGAGVLEPDLVGVEVDGIYESLTNPIGKGITHLQYPLGKARFLGQLLQILGVGVLVDSEVGFHRPELVVLERRTHPFGSAVWCKGSTGSR